MQALRQPIAITERMPASVATVARDFVEFTAQEYCRKLIKESGTIAHFVLATEKGPDIGIANAADLSLQRHEEVIVNTFSVGNLYLFKTV